MNVNIYGGMHPIKPRVLHRQD